MAISPDQRTTALFEIERLQEIIARHEEHTFKIRGWLYAVLAALTLGLYTESVDLAPLAYSELAIIVILLFFAWELVQRAPKRVAIDRVSLIEAELRGNGLYDGPLIAN